MSVLISSLPGKALRTLVDIARLAERFNKRSQSRDIEIYENQLGKLGDRILSNHIRKPSVTVV